MLHRRGSRLVAVPGAVERAKDDPLVSGGYLAPLLLTYASEAAPQGGPGLTLAELYDGTVAHAAKQGIKIERKSLSSAASKLTHASAPYLVLANGDARPAGAATH
jgi:hypothetical protein